MIAARSLLLLAAASTLAEAILEFQKSIVYDQFDFDGVDQLHLPLYCSAGCRIFASVPHDSAEIAMQIYVSPDEGMTKKSINDISLLEGEGERKSYYEITKPNYGIDLINENPDQKSAPLLLWIIQGDAPNIDNVEVYDAEHIWRPSAVIPKNGLVTILGAAPFQVTATVQDKEQMSYTAYMSGFESITNEIDQCSPSLTATFDDTSILAVRSPFITYVFDAEKYPDTKVELGSGEDVKTFDLAKPMFITSPGYVGCKVKESTTSDIRTKTFRSSRYEAKTEFSFASDRLTNVELSAEMVLDEAHAISITYDDTTEKWFGEQSKLKDVTAQKLSVTWDLGVSNQDANLFSLSIVPSSEPVRTSTTEETKTTTEEEVRTTTAEEPKTSSEAPKTTSEAPKTTTAAPKSTTQLPKTSTEPIKTSTSEPKTTTRRIPITTAYQRRTTTTYYRTTSTAEPYLPKSSTRFVENTSTSTAKTTTTTSGTAGTTMLWSTMAASILLFLL